MPIQLAVTCAAVRNISPLQREPIMLPFGKYWNDPAAKGTNIAAVIRQVLVHPTAACYKLKQLLNHSFPLDENGQYGISTRLTAI